MARSVCIVFVTDYSASCVKVPDNVVWKMFLELVIIYLLCE